MPEESAWNRTILQLPSPHLLQTSEWAELKAEVGWSNIRRTWEDGDHRIVAAASILKRTLRPLRSGPAIAILYIPRGPLLDWTDLNLCERVMNDLEDLVRKECAVFIKIDAEIPLGTGIPGEESFVEDAVGSKVVSLLHGRNWSNSPEQIQFKNTMLLDLTCDEEAWLTRMKQKTRYNLRLAQKSGVQVREARNDELGLLYQMYAETSVRDGFVIRSREYYLDVWQRFTAAHKAIPLLAEVDGKVVAGLILFVFGKRAWYLYGMSTQQAREKMPNYLLQWEAMRRAREMGCEVYDLWGAPDEFKAEDRMFGVFRFKEGLGAYVSCTPGALDFVNKKGLYFLYTKALPKVLGWMRRKRSAETQKEVM